VIRKILEKRYAPGVPQSPQETRNLRDKGANSAYICVKGREKRKQRIKKPYASDETILTITSSVKKSLHYSKDASEILKG